MIKILGFLNCSELAKELLARPDDFITVTVGNREYVISGIKRTKTLANSDDSTIYTTLVVEESSGCIIK